MVKNVKGGNKAKGQARKFATSKGSSVLRLSEDELEIYCRVDKILGGAMCYVVDLDGKKRLCHIRGKFRGRGKKDNFIGIGSWVLVGLRDWECEKKEGDSKLENCDLLEVYADHDKERLKSTVTHINWSSFNTDYGTSSEAPESNFEFANEKTQEYLDLIDEQLNAEKSGKQTALLADDDLEIDADDI